MQPTFFAPAERCSLDDLKKKLSHISDNPLMDGLLKSVNGLLAVLDRHRQVVAVNDALLKQTCATGIEEIFGLRLGEVIKCVHAREKPNGCGTTEYCVSCGAAIAMVASLSADTPVSRICAASIEKNGSREDVCFEVQSIPVNFAGERFLLIFLQDITRQQVWASLEKTFLHDINNVLTGLLCTTELLAIQHEEEFITSTVNRLVTRLKRDIDVQRTLAHLKGMDYKPLMQEVRISNLFEELQFNFLNNPITKNKALAIPQIMQHETITTDYSLIVRILTNMLANAFEATDPGGTVKLWYEQQDQKTRFNVWNDRAIPQKIQLRIFQRHFSTKSGDGRGMGTYSMKLLGEHFLKGQVGFTSHERSGTVFFLKLNQ